MPVWCWVIATPGAHYGNPPTLATLQGRDRTWRDSSEFFAGGEAIVAFVQRKWAQEVNCRRIASINDVPIETSERKFH